MDDVMGPEAIYFERYVVWPVILGILAAILSSRCACGIACWIVDLRQVPHSKHWQFALTTGISIPLLIAAGYVAVQMLTTEFYWPRLWEDTAYAVMLVYIPAVLLVVITRSTRVILAIEHADRSKFYGGFILGCILSCPVFFSLASMLLPPMPH